MSLSPRQRDIVIAVARHGMSYEATARYLKISMGTLETQLERIAAKYPTVGSRRDGLIHLYYTVVLSPDG